MVCRRTLVEEKAELQMHSGGKKKRGTKDTKKGGRDVKVRG